MTPEELGEYVCNSVKKGTHDKFLFVSGRHADGGDADICHIGNGPCGDANARRIARVPTLEAEVLRLREASAELADAFDDGLCNAGTPGFDGNRIYRAADAVRAILAGKSP